MIRALTLTAVLLLAAPACSDAGIAATPAGQVRSPTTGADASLLADALTEAEALPRLNSIIIARNGQILAERVYRGPSLDTPVNIKSASKSVLAALAGIAIG
jgi:CubicO group peptidase (beta-lactamase class C family)